MKILGDVLKLATQYLKERNISSPRRDAEVLLSHVLKMPRLDLYLQFDRPLHEEELSTFRSFLKRKAGGEPAEYICGEVSFFGCQIGISPDVLIPRPETEILLEKICQLVRAGCQTPVPRKIDDFEALCEDSKGCSFPADETIPERVGEEAGAQSASKGRFCRVPEFGNLLVKEIPLSGSRAWDICCGSGCMGIALKKRFPELAVTLADISEKALSIARENSRRNGVEVDLLCGDLLAPLQGRPKAHLVLCNPPYISRKEFNELDRSVKDFEPERALIGGEDGLLFYERLSRDLPECLMPQAQVFLEIGAGQGKAVSDLFNAAHWKAKRVEKDWAGHDRFFFLEFE